MFQKIIQHPLQAPLLHGLFDHVVRQAGDPQPVEHHMLEGLDGGTDQRSAQDRLRRAGGVAFGGLPALLQTALAKSAGESADAAQSMLVTVWNLGIAGGGLAGGVLLQGWGVAAFPWAVVLLMLWALAGASRGARS